MEVLIVRHAESMHNILLSKTLDSSLSERGYVQAQNLASWLKNNFNLSGYKGIVSPYLRTLQTACSISKKNNIEFTVHDGPREYHIDKNHYELEDGMLLPVRKNEFSHCNMSWPYFNDEFVFYKNEELVDFFNRIQLFTNSLNQNEKYLIVGHAASCRVIHDLLCDKGLDEVKTRYAGPLKPGNFSCTIKNASLTWIVDKESRWFSKEIT